MKWSRAVHHLEELADVCADMSGRPATIFPLRVTQLWTYSDVLTSHDDLDALRVVLAVDLPIDDVPWFCAPVGADHWSHATAMSKNPVVAMWRSTRAPVWNHHIQRPLLIWDESVETTSDVLSAIRNGTAEALRLPQPTPDEMQTRLGTELATSHRALESATADYEQRRFSPGKLEPVADRLWRATQGYLDVLAAIR
jgi:hypothetical protein